MTGFQFMDVEPLDFLADSFISYFLTIFFFGGGKLLKELSKILNHNFHSGVKLNTHLQLVPR
jgi:hypothetical protein